MRNIRGKQSLLKYLQYGYQLWKKNKDRHSWLFCPICDHDLNGDNESFKKVSKDHMFWYYKCANCGCKSKWHLYSMVPLPAMHQRFTRQMYKYRDNYKLRPKQPDSEGV